MRRAARPAQAKAFNKNRPLNQGGSRVLRTRGCWGFGVYGSEPNANWLDFVAGLGKRGLSGARLVTSDAREGIPLAAAEAFPAVP